MHSLPLILIATGCLTGAALAGGETVVVDTVEDSVDFGGMQRVGDLPGPGGKISFREALTAANNTPGPQTIHFAIPQSEWWLFDDRATLRQEDGVFWLEDDGTTVDFATQTQFTGDTNPDGNEVAIYGLQPNAWGVPSIYVSGNDCTISCLDHVMQRGYAIQIAGHDNQVTGCTIDGPLYAGVYITGGFGGDPPTGNVIGGTGPNDANVLEGGNSGVRIDGPADGNVVIGNVLSGPFAGVEVRGALQYDIHVTNNRIGGPTPEERNIISGAGHYGEEGFPVGQQISIVDAEGTIVEGNYIGTTADGSAAAFQLGPAGVSIRNSTGTVVRGNLISGLVVAGAGHHAGEFFGVGISIAGASPGTVITGNLIGTDASGTQPVPNLFGIGLGSWPGSGSPSATTIGGSGADANTIAFNEQAGIAVGGSTTSGTTISGNAIFANGALGIDLGTSGPTPNDPGDGDSGPNGLQNFPVIESALRSGAQIAVQGSLHSVAGQSYTIELFAGDACDPSGFGEGQSFLGSVDVTTDGAGNAAFDVSLPVELPAGALVTATATRHATGDSSEFSACTPVEEDELMGDVNLDGRVDVADLVALIMAWGDCRGCPEDLDGDGSVAVTDLVMLMSNWG